MRRLLVPLLVTVTACGAPDEPRTAEPAAASGFEPPVVTNPEPPVVYPPDLFEEMVEGTVMLRLFVDANGTVYPESTRVHTSSGNPRLDSAAVQGVDRMSFAPARRDGAPVAALFLQPVHFRHPENAASTSDGP